MHPVQADGRGEDVDRLLGRFPRVRLAGPSEEPALAEFHRSIEMAAGGISMSYDFGAAPLRAAAEAGAPSHVALFCEGDQIQGSASLSCRTGLLGANRLAYGYLANLRISPSSSRPLRREWREFFAALVREMGDLPSAGRPRFLLTTILDQNTTAVRFLTQHVKQVRYVPLQRYESVVAFGPGPWARRRVSGVCFRLGTGADLPRIRSFLVSSSAAQEFREDFRTSGADELERRLSTWEGFGLENFLLAERNDGQLVAVTAPRIPRHRWLLLRKVDAPRRWGLQAAALLGGRRLEVPGALKLLYLTHLAVDPGLPRSERNALLDVLLFEAHRRFQRPWRAHALCFARTPALGFPGGTLRGWARVRTPGTVYQVLPAEDDPDPELVRAARVAPLPLDLSTS
jgi:hypothetical protein